MVVPDWSVDRLPEFDPERGDVVLRPEPGAEGTWVGAPGVLVERDRFLLTYRQRRPRGDPATERGWRCAIAESTDGVRFTDTWSVTKDELGTPSMERFRLFPDRDGYLLYLSYVDPADGRWRIDAVRSDTPDGFDIGTRVGVLTAESTGTEGVKDPYLVRVDGTVHLFASFAAATLDPARRAEAHGTADIYTTGLTTHPTGHASGTDPLDLTWHGTALPVGDGWDRYQARLNSTVHFGSFWLGFYDGSASERENYEERCGLATSTDLRDWTSITPERPWSVSPHASGSLRYVDAVPIGDELHLYYEYARPDGAHELRLGRLPMPEIPGGKP